MAHTNTTLQTASLGGGDFGCRVWTWHWTRRSLEICVVHTVVKRFLCFFFVVRFFPPRVCHMHRYLLFIFHIAYINIDKYSTCARVVKTCAMSITCRFTDRFYFMEFQGYTLNFSKSKFMQKTHVICKASNEVGTKKKQAALVLWK